jgi:hypothetical protein
LKAEHEALSRLAATEEEARQRYGASDMQQFLQTLEALRNRMNTPAGLQALVDHLRRAGDPAALVMSLAGAHDDVQALAAVVDSTLSAPDQWNLEQTGELFRDLREALEDLPDLLPLLQAVHDADTAYAATVLGVHADPLALEALVADEAWRRLGRAHPVLERFSGTDLALATHAVAQAQRSLLAINADAIKATLQGQFSEHVRLSGLGHAAGYPGQGPEEAIRHRPPRTGT